MSSFAPSVEEERRAGIPVIRVEYPVGVAGVTLSLQEIAKRIREGASSPKVQGWTIDQLIAAGFSGRGSKAGNTRQRAAAVLNAVREATLYMPDPPNVEMVKSAEAMLCLREGLCIRGGDCDDNVVLLGSALMSIGIPVRVVKQTFLAEEQEHVLIEAYDDASGSWFYLDPSTNLPVGKAAHASSELRIDPLSNEQIGVGNTIPEAEFIGVGKAAGEDENGVPYDCPCRLPWAAKKFNALRDYGLAGTPVSPSSAAQTALDSMQTTIADGDTYAAAKDTNHAINAYKLAAAQGVTQVAPLLSAYNIGVAELAQADKLNATIQSSSDIAVIKADVLQMVSLYQAVEAQAPTAALGQQTLSPGMIALGVGGVLCIGIGAYLWATEKR